MLEYRNKKFRITINEINNIQTIEYNDLESVIASKEISLVKNIEIMHCDCTDSQSFAKMLSKAKNLENLTVRNSQLLKNDFANYLKVEHLEKVIKINITTSELGLRNFVSILSKARNLKELDISKTNFIAPFEITDITKETFLSYLETFTANNSNISFYNLCMILSRTDILKKLSLLGCANLNTNIFSINFSLPNLKSLYLLESNISLGNLYILLSKSKNLEDLDADCCKGLEDDTEKQLHPESLENLKKINLSFCKMHLKDTIKIFTNATQLKEIYLRGYKNNSIIPRNALITIIFKIKFENLNIIDFSNTNFNIDLVMTFLSSAYNLTELYLNNYNPIFNDNSDYLLNLKKLEIFEAVNSNLSLNSLSVILYSAKNLRQLDLSDCKNFTYQNNASFLSTILPILNLKNNPIIQISNTNIGNFNSNLEAIEKHYGLTDYMLNIESDLGYISNKIEEQNTKIEDNNIKLFMLCIFCDYLYRKVNSRDDITQNNYPNDILINNQALLKTVKKVKF